MREGCIRPGILRSRIAGYCPSHRNRATGRTTKKSHSESHHYGNIEFSQSSVRRSVKCITKVIFVGNVPVDCSLIRQLIEKNVPQTAVLCYVYLCCRYAADNVAIDASRAAFESRKGAH